MRRSKNIHKLFSDYMLPTIAILCPMCIFILAAPFVWNALPQDLHKAGPFECPELFSERTSLSI